MNPIDDAVFSPKWILREMALLEKAAVATMSGGQKTNAGIGLESRVGKHVVRDKWVVLGRDDEGRDGD